MVEAPKDLLDRMHAFLEECEKQVHRHTYIVVILMHELFRNLYPTDPYIPRTDGRHPLRVCAEVLERNIAILRQLTGIGAYPSDFSRYRDHGGQGELKESTGKVYGALWEEFTPDIVEEATAMLRTRLAENEIGLHLFAGKRVLDAGCGSGRYSIALSRLGAAEVVGVDYGDQGLAFGTRLAEHLRMKNVRFQKGSLLDLPFPEGSFDFVYANGTIHHTGNIPLGTREVFRVLKDGGSAWIYLYGAGGFFWTARLLMNQFMKKIPQGFTMEVLRLINMPRNRFIFCDTWYVPIEAHTTREAAETLFRQTGFTSWKRCSRGVDTDIDYLAWHGTKEDRLMWGDGDHRYLLEK